MADTIMTKKSRRLFLKSFLGFLSLPFLYLGKNAADTARRWNENRILNIPLKDIRPGQNDFDTVIILKDRERLTVLSRECTHLGCRIHAKGDGYVCPCHGSEFTREGKVSRGPAARDLRKLAFSKTGDSVRIRV